MTNNIKKLISDIKDTIDDVARLYGDKWDSSLVGSNGGDVTYHAITSNHTNNVVARTSDGSRESSWLCDYLESVSPANIKALIVELEQSQKLNQCYMQREREGARESVIDGLARRGEPAWEIEDYMKQWDKENAVFLMANTIELKKPRLAPHKYRECVNELTVITKRYAAAGQLREQISSALSKYIDPNHPHTRKESELCVKPLCVKLPAPVNVKMGGDAKTKAMFSGMNMMLEDCKNAILAAGGTVEENK